MGKYKGALIVGEFADNDSASGYSYAKVCWELFKFELKSGGLSSHFEDAELATLERWWQVRIKWMSENSDSGSSGKRKKRKNRREEVRGKLKNKERLLPIPHVVDGNHEEVGQALDRSLLYDDLNLFDIRCIISLANSEATIELLEALGPLTTRPVSIMVASHENLWSHEIWKSREEKGSFAENGNGTKSSCDGSNKEEKLSCKARLVKTVQQDTVVRMAPTNEQQARAMLGLLRAINDEWDLWFFTAEEDKHRAHAGDLENLINKHRGQYLAETNVSRILTSCEGLNKAHVAHAHVAVMAFGHTATLKQLKEKLAAKLEPPKTASGLSAWGIEKIIILYSDGCSEWDKPGERPYANEEVRDKLDETRAYLGKWLVRNVDASAYRLVSERRPQHLLRDTWEKIGNCSETEEIQRIFREGEKSGFKFIQAAPLDS